MIPLWSLQRGRNYYVKEEPPSSWGKVELLEKKHSKYLGKQRRFLGKQRRFLGKHRRFREKQRRFLVKLVR
jgi:hypothetical protein